MRKSEIKKIILEGDVLVIHNKTFIDSIKKMDLKDRMEVLLSIVDNINLLTPYKTDYDPIFIFIDEFRSIRFSNETTKGNDNYTIIENAVDHFNKNYR